MQNFQINDKFKENAYLVYLDKEDSEYELREMKELMRSANLDFAGCNCVYLREINPATYIGSGKVAEIKEEISNLNVDVIIFDMPLTGSQMRNLSEELNCKIIDRTMLILDIFAARATSSEGKLQVSLAQSLYSKSRLNALTTSADRYGSGGVGMRGPGETKIELDRRKIDEQISKLKQKIKDVEKNRALNTQKRKKNNEFSVSLIGYSNAGKSTLLNTITKADAYADNKLFATLDVLTKKVWDQGCQYVLSDTVGFISNLPHELMNAFSATLDEVRESDLLLIVLDASDPKKYEQLKIVEQEMKKQGRSKDDSILIFNKIDKLAPSELANLSDMGYSCCFISAKTGFNLQSLKNSIREKLSNKCIVKK